MQRCIYSIQILQEVLTVLLMPGVLSASFRTAADKELMCREAFKRVSFNALHCKVLLHSLPNSHANASTYHTINARM